MKNKLKKILVSPWTALITLGVLVYVGIRKAHQGQIVWNELPSLGGPIGWVCLGRHRWARFGKIE